MSEYSVAAEIRHRGLADLRQKIMTACDTSLFDHRPDVPERVKEMYPHILEDCQLQYSRFKLAVAKVLQPRTILEVGVGWGISANAFFHGCPSAEFIGIDNATDGMHPSEVLRQCHGWALGSSDDFPSFSHPELFGNTPIDLIHIDGGHGLEQKARDIVKALEAEPEWILVDDVSNVMVAAGTFAGLYQAHACPDINMLMFEHSHTGNLLIHANRQPVEYRGLEIRRV